MTSSLGDEVRRVVVPSPRSVGPRPLIVEIGTTERWTIMDKEPFQVFEAFNLPQDAEYYDAMSREDQVLRCKRRIGRLVADALCFSESYVESSDKGARAALQRELEASRKSCIMLEDKQRKADSEVKRLEEKIFMMLKESKDLRAALEKKEGLLTEATRLLGERTTAWEEEKSALEREVDTSLEDGYDFCWSMASIAGIDMLIFTFANYLKTLNDDGGSDHSQPT